MQNGEILGVRGENLQVLLSKHQQVIENPFYIF